MSVIINIFNALLLLTLPLQCWNPFMIFKLTNTRFDFIVVGGGSAGSVVASRLSENSSVNVLLLEAGGCPSVLNEVPAVAPLIFGTYEDWQYETAPQNNSFLSYPNRQAKYPQGKVLGGSSTINLMMYVRGNSWDFDNWAAMGNQGWGYNDVLPFFMKAEGNRVPVEENDATYHNTKGPLIVSRLTYQTPSLEAFLKSGEEIGYPITDYNGKQQIGVAPFDFTMSNGERCSTEKAYLRPARSRPNLVISTDSFVTKILFNEQKQAIGVQFVKDRVTHTVKVSKEVILSAGVFGSPKILKLSGVGPALELNRFNIPVVADLPGVGQNLNDHIACPALIWTLNCSQCTTPVWTLYSPINLAKWILFRDGPLTDNFGLEGTAFVKSNSSGDIDGLPDIQFFFTTLDLNTQSSLLSWKLGPSYAHLSRYFGPIANKNTFSLFVYLLRPKSRGSLDLQSNDPMKPPLLNFRYFSHEDDMKQLIKGVKVAVQLGNSKAFASLGAQLNPTVYPGCDGVPQFSDAYWECVCRHYTLAGIHAVGTCKMGVASDQLAVVDAHLKVYKTSNLRVADSSVMPQITSGNTNAPTIMIAEKASDAIKKDHALN